MSEELNERQKEYLKELQASKKIEDLARSVPKKLALNRFLSRAVRYFNYYNIATVGIKMYDHIPDSIQNSDLFRCAN